MPCYSIDGIVPVVDRTAFVHPSAVIIGDVVVGPECYVGPCAALRGDFGRIIIRRGASVQDTCVVHSFPNVETVVEEYCDIGHGAILHGCLVRRAALVGMNAVVMDEAEIGENAIVAASSFVRAGMKVSPGSLVAGVPAKFVRELSEAEISWKLKGSRIYQDLVKRCLATMEEVVPLTAIEPNRGRLQVPEAEPLIAIKRK